MQENMHRRVFLSICLATAMAVGCNSDHQDATHYTQAYVEELRAFRKPIETRLDILPDSLQRLLLDSLEQLRTTNPIHQLAIYRILHRSAFHDRDFANALFFINREIDLLHTLNTDGSFHPDTYFRRGDVFFELRQYDLAFKDYTNGLAFAGDRIDLRTKADFNHRIGQLHYRRSEFKKAIEYYLKSLQLFQQIESKVLSDQYRQQELCGNLALSYWRINELEKSVAWYDSALSYIEELPKRTPRERQQQEVALQVILGNQGIVWVEKGLIKQGMEQTEKSMKFNRGPKGDQGHAAFTAHQLAKFALQQNNLSLAKAYLDTARAIVAHQALSQAHLVQEKTYIDYYIRTGQVDSLSRHLHLYMQIGDSLKSNERILAAVNTDQLIAGLEKDFALKAEQSKNAAQSKINRVLFGLVGSLLFGLSLIGWMWQRGKRKNKMLQSLNRHIREQHTLLEKAQLEQIETNDRLEQLNRQKDKLLRVVAHDLRNPLAAIHAMSGLLLEEDKASAEREFLELAHQACKGGLDLIGELLDQKQLTDSENSSFNRREFIPALAFLTDTLRLVKHRADAKDMRLVLDCSFEGALFIDLERMRRAITNLIVNAIKFSPRGSTVEVVCKHEHAWVILSVRDYGIGIPPQDISHLFESFTSTKRTGTEGEKPFGLGLSITKQIAEEHQGKIEVESTEGSGSVFRLCIPAALAENK